MTSLRLLSGRLTLVTGAGSGIGKSTCEVFAREGAVIAAVDINKDSAETVVKSLPAGDGIKHHAFYADVSSSSDVKSLIQDVQSAFSRLPTVAVNCAGIAKEMMLHDITEEMFDETISINLKGTFLVTQMLTKALVAEGITGVSIVNMASAAAKGGGAGYSPYAASKGGVVSFTKSAAKELVLNGIRVNAIVPGLIDTPLWGSYSEEFKRNLAAEVPLGRFGKPEEVANVCLFLASEMSSYVTGAAVEVTGGFWM